MSEKAYRSNISKAWPMERQAAALGDREHVYNDVLGPKAIRNGNPAFLKERATMLAPTSRQSPETITVASFRCLAFSAQDLAGVIAAAAARNATLHALDTGVTIEPHAAGQLVAEQIEAFSRIVRNGGKGRTKAEIGAETMAESRARAELIRADWAKPSSEFSTKELLVRAGKNGKPMAPATAREILDRRPLVQRAYQNELNREAGRAAARASKKEAKA